MTIDGAEPVPLGYELCGGASNRFDSGLPPDDGDGPSFVLTRRRTLGHAGMVESFGSSPIRRGPGTFAYEAALACDLAAISTVKAGLPANRPARHRHPGRAGMGGARAVVGASVGVPATHLRKRG